MQEEAIAQDLKDDAQAFEEVTIRLGWLARRRLEQELAEYQLTVPQFIALRCIRESARDGCSMSELAESSHQVSATMTGIVDRLVDRGLVQRNRDLLDRRAWRVMLTPEGHALLIRIDKEKNAWIMNRLGDLPVEDRKRLVEILRRYVGYMEQALQTADHTREPVRD